MDLSWRDQSGRICFPPGLLPVVRKAAQTARQQIEVQDQRVLPPDQPQDIWEAARALGERIGNRDYQTESLVALAQGTSESMEIAFPLPGRGICKAPTGSGKGRVAASVPLLFPGRWAFLVHRSHLAKDIAERYEQLSGEPAGWIAEGQWQPGNGLTCCTIQTLFQAKDTPRFREWAKGIIGVEIDECHTAAADTNSAVSQAFPNAYYKFGFSGTPLDRTDKRSILAVSAIGPVVYEIKAVDLIEQGFIAKPTVRIVPCWQPKYEGSDWQGLYESRIKKSPHRNAAILAAMVASEAPGIVFVRHLDHGKELVRLAHSKGLDADFVHGSWSLSRRQSVIRQLQTGRLQWIVASSVFSEGVDIPCLRTVINGGGGKSIIQTLQQVGRGTRITEDKNTFVVYDIGDKGNRSLHDHSRERIRAMQREGYEVIVDNNLWPEKAARESLQ